MRDFKNLRVWERAHALTLSVYGISRTFPVSERYGLRDQLRRCSVSIPANIAEGCGSQGDMEFARYLGIARASAGELEYQLILARDLAYIDSEQFENLAQEAVEVQKMLVGLIRSLRG
jgi:four helix bundle protein